jgi:hypothetical protein
MTATAMRTAAELVQEARAEVENIAPKDAYDAGPQRDSNPRYGLERAATWTASRWGRRGPRYRSSGLRLGSVSL